MIRKLAMLSCVTALMSPANWGVCAELHNGVARYLTEKSEREIAQAGRRLVPADYAQVSMLLDSEHGRDLAPKVVLLLMHQILSNPDCEESNLVSSLLWRIYTASGFHRTVQREAFDALWAVPPGCLSGTAEDDMLRRVSQQPSPSLVLALGLSKSARTLGKLREVLASKDPEIAFAAKTSLARRDDAAAVAELVAEYARTVAQQVDYADEIGCKHYDRLCETIAFQIGSVEALVAMFDHGLRSPSAGSEGLGLGVRILPPWTGAVQNLRLVFQDVGIAVPDFQTQKDAASWWEVNRQKAESALHRDQERLKTLAGRNRLRQILKTRALPPPDSNLGFTVQ